jgi:hypothetical protein
MAGARRARKDSGLGMAKQGDRAGAGFYSALSTESVDKSVDDNCYGCVTARKHYKSFSLSNKLPKDKRLTLSVPYSPFAGRHVSLTVIIP